MRDIEKDKAHLKSQWSIESVAIGEYWIAQYEAAQAYIVGLDFQLQLALSAEDAWSARAKAAELRVHALESQLQLRNRPDVASRTEHDIALEGIFGEMEGMKDAR